MEHSLRTPGKVKVVVQAEERACPTETRVPLKCVGAGLAHARHQLWTVSQAPAKAIRADLFRVFQFLVPEVRRRRMCFQHHTVPLKHQRGLDAARQHDCVVASI
jgi:hypothetical protein